MMPQDTPSSMGNARTLVHIDGCPECIDNAEAPHLVEVDSPTATTEHYRCTDCGYSWTTAWDEG